MSVENVNPKRPPNGRWRKGTSGNAAGRPTGSRNQSTVFFQELLNGQGEALIQKGIELFERRHPRAEHLLGPPSPTSEGANDRVALAERNRCQKRLCRSGIGRHRRRGGQYHTRRSGIPGPCPGSPIASRRIRDFSTASWRTREGSNAPSTSAGARGWFDAGMDRAQLL